MNEKTETGHAGGFILSEGNGHISRENILIAEGQVLVAGQVIGLLTSGSDSGGYVAFDEGASTGAEDPIGIIIDDCDATDAAKEAAVMVRNCEVNGKELVWPDAISDPDKATAVTALAALGIIVR